MRLLRVAVSHFLWYGRVQSQGVIEIDTSRAEQLIFVIKRLRYTRGLPDMLQMDNAAELLGEALVEWMRNPGVLI
jgi:hypothetical protein